MGGLIDLPEAKSVDQCLKGLIAKASDLHGTSTLDLGCGTNPQNPFRAEQLYGIDIRDSPSKYIKCADLTVEPIPFEDNAFDSLLHLTSLNTFQRLSMRPIIAFHL